MSDHIIDIDKEKLDADIAALEPDLKRLQDEQTKMSTIEHDLTVVKRRLALIRYLATDEFVSLDNFPSESELDRGDDNHRRFG